MPGAGRRRGENWQRNREQIKGDCDDIIDKVGEIEQNPLHRPGKANQRLIEAAEELAEDLTTGGPGAGGGGLK